MYRVLKILTDAEVAECRKIAASAPFVDGRITNPHNKTKQNERLSEVRTRVEPGLKQELAAAGFALGDPAFIRRLGRRQEHVEQMHRVI